MGIVLPPKNHKRWVVDTHSLKQTSLASKQIEGLSFKKQKASVDALKWWIHQTLGEHKADPK